METIRIALKDLVQNTGQIPGLPANPRQWTKKEIDKIAKSLQETPELFEARPIIVIPWEGKYIILGGNLRYEGCRRNKDKDAPCFVIPDNTPVDKMKEIIIKDNGSFGEWDYDALGNLWDDLPLADWGVPAWDMQEVGGSQPDVQAVGGGQPDVQEDDFNPDDGVLVRCNPGDIWQLGDHRLMCGDSTDAGAVAMLMNGERSDMVFTDPPYGMTALKWDVKIDLEKMFDNIWSACKKNAYVLFTGMQPFVTDLINAGRGFFRHEIIWKKTQSTGFLQANHAPLKIHENILVFCKGNGTYNPQKKVVGEGTGRVRHQSANRAAHYHGNHESVYVDDGTRFPTSVIEFSNWNGALFGNVSNAVSHPTQKPVDLVAYLIETYSNNNDFVLDLFGGSGTTLIAAEQTGRKCYMMELDPHYCDVIIARWEKLTGKEATKLN